MLRYLGGGLLVLLWPVGLPAGLFYAMRTRRARIIGGTLLTIEDPRSYSWAPRDILYACTYSLYDICWGPR